MTFHYKNKSRVKSRTTKIGIMDKKQLEISKHNQQLGEIKFPRSQAQADYKIAKKEVKRKDGTVFYKKTTTTNDEKISDACVQIFQQSSLAQEFDYDKLRQKAEEVLFPRFEKYGLIVDDTKTKKDKHNIEKKQEIAISQYIRKHIENNLDLTFEVDFDKFIDMTGVKSAKRIGNALKMLDEVQTKATYEYKQPEINEDFSEITYELAKVATIPKISLILDEEMGEKYETIGEYASSDIKNKKKHIKGVRFDIGKSYLSSVLGLGRDYTSTNRKDRNKFNSSYSYRLDILLKSIEKVQHIQKFNFYTFQEIQKKFGTNFKEWRDFKRRVLNPAIKDINEFTPLTVELVEHRENDARNKELDGISFRISRKLGEDKKTKFGIDKTAFYIASRLFYFTNQKIENLLGFAKHIEQSFNSLDIVMYDNRYVNEWRVESEEAIESEIEVVKFIENNRKLCIEHGIDYDEKRMCIIEKTIKSEDKDGNHNPRETIKLITTSDYRVENPQTSIRYLKELIEKEGRTVYSIVDFLPFHIAVSTGWKLIETVKDYQKYESNILHYMKERKLNFFKFENNIFEDTFHTNIMRDNFKELNDDYRKMIMKLTKDKDSSMLDEPKED